MNRKLPIWSIVQDACQFPWHHRREVGFLLIIPVVLSLLLMIPQHYFLLLPLSPSFTDNLPFVLYFPLVESLVFTFFAVSYHRFILIGHASISWFGVRGWSVRETRFFLWLIGMYIIAMLSIAFFSTVTFFAYSIGGAVGDALILSVEHPSFPYVSTLLAVTPFVYVIGRLSLILPAVAIDLRPTIAFTLSLSNGNGWRVTLLVGGSPFVFWGLYSFLAWALGGESLVIGRGPDSNFVAPSLLHFFLEKIFSYLWLTIEVAVLSFTYRELSQWQVSQDPSPALP